MRRENFTVGSFVHVYNRGNRKQPIVRDQRDKWHFLELLFYFNNEFAVTNFTHRLNRLRSNLNKLNRLRSNLDLNQSRSNLDLNRLRSNLDKLKQPEEIFVWPEEWPSRKPIVKILAFSLLENHFHLLLKEIREGGISLFMQKFGTGMATYFNIKYKEVGSLFQGSYKARRIEGDLYLKYLSVYIQVKNPFENYPGGFQKAVRNFDKAYAWAMKNPYCSLADYAGLRNSSIIDKDILGEIFSNSEEYKKFARQCLIKTNLEEKLGKLTLESK